MRCVSSDSPSGSLGATALEAACTGEQATARRWQVASPQQPRKMALLPHCQGMGKVWPAVLTPEFPSHPLATATVSGLFLLPQTLCIFQWPLSTGDPEPCR